MVSIFYQERGPHINGIRFMDRVDNQVIVPTVGSLILLPTQPNEEKITYCVEKVLLDYSAYNADDPTLQSPFVVVIVERAGRQSGGELLA